MTPPRNFLLSLLLVLLLARGVAAAPVSDEAASAALQYALARLGDPYVWGGQSPGGVDCSGLILWAYEQALHGIRVPAAGRGYALDATIDHLWKYASRPVHASEVRSGDVVFITNENGRITHGGLVISVSETEVTFVNASSYHGEVVVETWPLEGEKRGQWVVAFGRLVAIPGRRPPMPATADSWGAWGLALPLSLAPGTGVRALVSDDGLQSELAVTKVLGPVRVGVGMWSWRDGWRGDQYIFGGNVAFGLVNAAVAAGPMVLSGEATYSEAGMSYVARAVVSRSIASGTLEAAVSYRHWAEDPWYSGPSISVAVTF